MKISTAKHIKDTEFTDLQNRNISLSYFQHENGAVFAIDSSYVEYCDNDKGYVSVPDPFNIGRVVRLFFD